jgi:hypothetical protein
VPEFEDGVDIDSFPRREPITPHPSRFPIEGVFLAGDHEVSADLADFGPGPEFTLSWGVRDLSQIELAQLGEILGAGSYDDLFAAMPEFPHTNVQCGLFRVAPQIRDKLVALNEVEPVALEWAASEEIEGLSWTEEDARVVVDGLVALARQARVQEKQLWIWWSL